MTGLLHSIFAGVWAMEPSRVLEHLPQLKGLLTGTTPVLTPEQLEALRAEHQPYLLNGDGETVNADGQPSQEQYVMVLPLRGTMLRYDQACGPYGCETRAKLLRRADADPNILGVVLDVDSGGGQGSAMEVLVHQIRAMKKPVVTYVNHGMCASAAYGTAATTAEIILSYKSDAVGSIGTLMAFPDLKKHYKEHWDLLMHEVYATLSTEKNGPIREAFLADPDNPEDEHYNKLRTELLDPWNEQFIEHIQNSRPKVKAKDGVFNGKLFLGDEAIRLGLADRYGTLADATERVRQLSKTGSKGGRSNETTNPTTQTDMSLKKHIQNALEGVKQLFGAGEKVNQETLDTLNEQLKEDGIDQVVLVSADAHQQFEAAEERVATAQQATDALNASLQTLATELKLEVAEGATLMDTVAGALRESRAEVTRLEARVAELEDTPADDGKGQRAKTEAGGDNPDLTGEDDPKNYEHNKAAREAREKL